MIKIYDDKKEKANSFEAKLSELDKFFKDKYYVNNVGVGRDTEDAINDLKSKLNLRITELEEIIITLNNLDYNKFQYVNFLGKPLTTQPEYDK